ncbi:hypothetical protein MTO96_032106 [Rhipicephalus appendiculatus]
MDVENYRYPRPDDVFVATYPKCGTTWTQYLILSILNKGDPPKTYIDFMLASPFLEMMGAEAAEKMVRPGVLKIHLPFNKTPYTEPAKYIYVARNPVRRRRPSSRWRRIVTWICPEKCTKAKAFIRKGIVGDWRTHFTPEQIANTKAWIEEKTKGTDVMQLWSDIGLP